MSTHFSASLTHTQSYNQLLNLRTTLLHLQYLYSSLQQSLQIQHKNQQYQHKDHIIQCFNVNSQLNIMKENNFKKILIIKLEELLAIQQENNQKLLSLNRQYKQYNMKYDNNNNNNISNNNNNNRNDQATLLSSICPLQQLSTLISLTQSQQQQQLCKLYIGKNTYVDLQKISSQFQVIQNKIDEFIQKYQQPIKYYNNKIQQIQIIKGQYQKYMDGVHEQVRKFRKNNNNDCKENNVRKYQQHVKTKLIFQSQQIQSRINNIKLSLLS